MKSFVDCHAPGHLVGGGGTPGAAAVLQRAEPAEPGSEEEAERGHRDPEGGSLARARQVRGVQGHRAAETRQLPSRPCGEKPQSATGGGPVHVERTSTTRELAAHITATTRETGAR